MTSMVSYSTSWSSSQRMALWHQPQNGLIKSLTFFGFTFCGNFKLQTPSKREASDSKLQDQDSIEPGASQSLSGARPASAAAATNGYSTKRGSERGTSRAAAETNHLERYLVHCSL